jgi:hypothetical protein
MAAGTKVALSLSEDDLTGNMNDSLSHSLLSSGFSAFKAHVVRASELDAERLGINCGKLPTMQNSAGDGCHCFDYRKKDVFVTSLKACSPRTPTVSPTTLLYMEYHIPEDH